MKYSLPPYYPQAPYSTWAFHGWYVFAESLNYYWLMLGHLWSVQIKITSFTTITIRSNKSKWQNWWRLAFIVCINSWSKNDSYRQTFVHFIVSSISIKKNIYLNKICVEIKHVFLRFFVGNYPETFQVIYR